MNDRKSVIFIVCVYLLTVFFIPLYDAPRREVNTNERIRAYLTMALVEDGTSVVDRQVAEYGLPLDRAEKDGHVYCDKVPGLSFMAIPAYVLILLVESLFSARAPFYLIVYILRVFAVGVPVAVMLFYMVKLLEEHVEEDVAYFCAAVYALGTIALPMSTAFFGHQAAAAFSFLAYYAAKKGTVAGRQNLLFISGVLAGVSVMTEFPTVIIAAAIALMVLSAQGRRGRILYYIAGMAPPLALLLCYNRFTFGHALDFGYGHTQHYFMLLGLDKTGPSAALGLPSLSTLWHMSFSPYRGFIFFSPVMLFSLYGLLLLCRQGEKAEAALVGACALSYFVFNSMLRDWEGGWSPGLRHLVPVAPVLVLPLGLAAQAIARSARETLPKKFLAVIFCAASLVSISNNCLAAMTYIYFPWGVFNPLKDICLTFFKSGVYSLNLLSMWGAPGWAGAIVASGIILALIAGFCRNAIGRLLPVVGMKIAVLALVLAWCIFVLLLSPVNTMDGEKYLALIYWNNRLGKPFLDAGRKIIERSPDREEKIRYARACIYMACEIMKEPRRALWFYDISGAYEGGRGDFTD